MPADNGGPRPGGGRRKSLTRAGHAESRGSATSAAPAAQIRANLAGLRERPTTVCPRARASCTVASPGLGIGQPRQLDPVDRALPRQHPCLHATPAFMHTFSARRSRHTRPPRASRHSRLTFVPSRRWPSRWNVITSIVLATLLVAPSTITTLTEFACRLRGGNAPQLPSYICPGLLGPPDGKGQFGGTAVWIAED